MLIGHLIQIHSLSYEKACKLTVIHRKTVRKNGDRKNIFTNEEKEQIKAGMKVHGYNWKKISEQFCPTKLPVQIGKKARSLAFLQKRNDLKVKQTGKPIAVKQKRWTSEESVQLVDAIAKHGINYKKL